MSAPHRAFGQTLLSLTPVLEAAGFVVSDERYDDASFGSRYTTFDRGDQEIRLMWDGKESWLVLEARPLSHRQFPHGWVDLALHKATSDGPQLLEVTEEMIQALNRYLQAPVT
jgi:hypothetical protein